MKRRSVLVASGFADFEDDLEVGADGVTRVIRLIPE